MENEEETAPRQGMKRARHEEEEEEEEEARAALSPEAEFALLTLPDELVHDILARTLPDALTPLRLTSHAVAHHTGAVIMQELARAVRSDEARVRAWAGRTSSTLDQLCDETYAVLRAVPLSLAWFAHSRGGGDTLPYRALFVPNTQDLVREKKLTPQQVAQYTADGRAGALAKAVGRVLAVKNDGKTVPPVPSVLVRAAFGLVEEGDAALLAAYPQQHLASALESKQHAGDLDFIKARPEQLLLPYVRPPGAPCASYWSVALGVYVHLVRVMRDMAMLSRHNDPTLAATTFHFLCDDGISLLVRVLRVWWQDDPVPALLWMMLLMRRAWNNEVKDALHRLYECVRNELVLCTTLTVHRAAQKPAWTPAKKDWTCLTADISERLAAYWFHVPVDAHTAEYYTVERHSWYKLMNGLLRPLPLRMQAPYPTTMTFRDSSCGWYLSPSTADYVTSVLAVADVQTRGKFWRNPHGRSILTSYPRLPSDPAPRTERDLFAELRTHLVFASDHMSALRVMHRYPLMQEDILAGIAASPRWLETLAAYLNGTPHVLHRLEDVPPFTDAQVLTLIEYAPEAQRDAFQLSSLIGPTRPALLTVLWARGLLDPLFLTAALGGDPLTSLAALIEVMAHGQDDRRYALVALIAIASAEDAYSAAKVEEIDCETLARACVCALVIAPRCVPVPTLTELTTVFAMLVSMRRAYHASFESLVKCVFRLRATTTVVVNAEHYTMGLLAVIAHEARRNGNATLLTPTDMPLVPGPMSTVDTRATEVGRALGWTSNQRFSYWERCLAAIPREGGD